MNIILNKKESEELYSKGLIQSIFDKLGIQPIKAIFRRGDKLVIKHEDSDDVPIILIGGTGSKFVIHGYTYPFQLKHEWFYTGDKWIVPSWMLESIEMLLPIKTTRKRSF